MLVTRQIINKDIEFIDVNQFSPCSYSFNELSNGIDYIKDKLLNEFRCEHGDSVLIGMSPCTLQIATFFACAELGLQVIILDHDRNDNWIIEDYIDPKTRSLMPIKYFIVDSTYHQIPWKKHNFFKKICEHFVILELDCLKHSFNVAKTETYAKPESILLKCTSSGTTGTAKVVKHTHSFFHQLILRNSVFYDNTVCMIANLNHGSSPATYFLPAVVSKNTTRFLSSRVNDFPKQISKYDVRHLMIPYTHMIQHFFDISGKFPELCLYTLSTIQESWLDLYKDKKIGNIISFFGCNETSGPLLINQINDVNFKESSYKLMDDFYKLNLIEDRNLEVEMPVYGTKIRTNDVFALQDGYYHHKGRNDLYRVNGCVVDLIRYNEIAKELIDATVIVDTIKDNLYVAVWQDVEDIADKICRLSERFHSMSNGAHKVNKFAILSKDKFYSGVKLDMELLRDYFRKFVVQGKIC